MKPGCVFACSLAVELAKPSCLLATMPPTMDVYGLRLLAASPSLLRLFVGTCFGLLEECRYELDSMASAYDIKI